MCPNSARWHSIVGRCLEKQFTRRTMHRRPHKGTNVIGLLGSTCTPIQEYAVAYKLISALAQVMTNKNIRRCKCHAPLTNLTACLFRCFVCSWTYCSGFCFTCTCTNAHGHAWVTANWHTLAVFQPFSIRGCCDVLITEHNNSTLNKRTSKV